MAKASKAPTGLAISRNGGTFSLSWKIGDKNYKGGQQLQYGRNNTGWISKSIGATTKSTSISYNLSNTNFTSVSFRVRGKAKGKGWSAWSTKTYSLAVPPAPTISAELTRPDRTVFTWAATNDATSNRPFRQCQWQTVLIRDCNVNDGSKVNWSGATTNTSGASSSTTQTETGWAESGYSYRRWVRVRSVGPAGASSWVYASHIYALPERTNNVTATLEHKSDGGYTVLVNWGNSNTVARPIDEVTVNYCITTPNSSISTEDGQRVVSLSCPSSASWTKVATVSGNNGSRGMAIPIGRNLSDDELIFVRVDTKHDEYTVEGSPVMATGVTGALKKPTGVSVSNYNPTTHRCTITATNSSSVSASFTAIYFRTSSDQSASRVIGVIPPGSSSITCMLPEWPEGDEISVGAQAYAASYSPVEPEADATTTYSITNVQMASELNWDGGSVPLPPANIKLAKKTETSIQVGWDWTWTDATGAEISWAENEDAWNSTNGPQTYIVDNTHAGSWIVAGLSIGTWYVRIRLLRASGDITTYGTYSAIHTIKLSSSPDIPSLLLSDGIISKDASVTCYWAYVSTDGTAQMQAEVTEAFITEYEAVSSPTGSPFANQYYEVSRTDYSKSSDTEIVTGKTYYTRIFEVVVDPTGSPTTNKYYELIDNTDYVLTVDEMVNEEKTYYSLSYTTVADPTGDPSASDYYEFINVSYARSNDTSVVEDKTYYLASIANATYSDTPLAVTSTAQHVTINAEDHNWQPGETHYLAVRVTAGSGELSNGWSTPVPVTIAEEITSEITSTSLVEQEITVEPGVTRTVMSLTQLPLTISAKGAGLGGTTTYIIERAADYHMDRPDESEYDGFEGETIAIQIQNGEDSASIEQSDLLGMLDDGASYRILATAKDSYGQTNTATLEFEVHWTHQAIMPEATVEVDQENNIVMITPIQPEGFVAGDTCDIYRLSVDKPELIVSGAAFGTKYVDPYPTLGEFGGHRVVYRTLYGDYITNTEDGEMAAWMDYTASEDDAYKLNLFGVVIDFDGDQLVLPYNVGVSNSWKKDFEETKYLGGSVRGDWNPAVSRNSSASTVIPIEYEPENIELLRKLAVYPGICHVRTPDGSSYAANIEVKDDREEKWTRKLSKVSLDITRIDPEGFEGMTYQEWIEDHSE